MYRLQKCQGDSIAVPQLVFSRLCIAGSDDGRFRVALYLLQSGSGDAAAVAAALKMPRSKVEAALAYWEGAGLLMQDTPAAEAPPTPQKRRVMTAAEVVQAGKADPTLGFLLEELQRLAGTVLQPEEINRFVTLYVQDKTPADVVLMATSYCIKQRGVKSANYVRRVLDTWREAGVHDSTSADTYLKREAERAAREKKLAKHLGYQSEEPFTMADRKKIIQWFEEYGYDFEMIELARLTAGDKREIKYLHAILRKWHASGHQNMRDVQQAGEGIGMRAMRDAAPATGGNDLMGAAAYVPLGKRGKK